NFMPVFDWTRTELARVREDGTTVLAYNQDTVDKMDPDNMFDSIKDNMNGTVMPGWEPERMEKVKELFELYKDIDEEKLFENLKYFLEAIMPVCTNMTSTWQFIQMTHHGAYLTSTYHFFSGKIKTSD
ncbi:MAG: mannonate dehydratase, partial [Blautia producta]